MLETFYDPVKNDQPQLAEAFLAAGGKITQLEITMSAEKLNQQRGSN